jgi:hypothetical protein
MNMATANKGAKSEKKVQEYLEAWTAASPNREFNRLVDSKAAGRIIKAAKADFEYFSYPLGLTCSHGLIEVKETEHEYRLTRAHLTQLPSLRKREKCGGISMVLVFHSTLKVWRVVGIEYLAKEGDKGSWNLTDFPTYPTCGAAMAAFRPLDFK